MHKDQWKSSLSACLILLFLLTSCFPGDQIVIVEQVPSPTVLSTPIVKNFPMLTDTVQANPEPPLPGDPVPTPPSSAPDKNIFGVALQTISTQDGLTLFSEAGSTWTRRDFTWNVVEPNEGDRIGKMSPAWRVSSSMLISEICRLYLF